MTDEKMIDEMMVDAEMMMVSRCQSDKPPAPPFRPEPLPLALGELRCDPKSALAAQGPYAYKTQLAPECSHVPDSTPRPTARLAAPLHRPTPLPQGPPSPQS